MKTFNFFLFYFLFTLSLTSQTINKKIYPINPIPSFQPGEELKYVLKYGFITGGAALIKVAEEQYNNQNVIRATATARTTGLVNRMFKVLDTYESFFTPDSNLPLRAIRNIREGNYRYYGEDNFNHRNNTVINVKKGVQKVPDNILDMVSSLFYIRRIDFTDFKIGDIVYVDTYFSDDLFPFYIIFKGREEIKTDAGTFNCIKFLPIVEPGRIFKENDDMLIWLSDDDNKIPVKISFDMVVGSFKCELESFKNLKYTPKSIIKN
jgi:hypothetical protein